MCFSQYPFFTYLHQSKIREFLMTAALVDRRKRGLAVAVFVQITDLNKKARRESIKGEKARHGKSINLVDLPFFSLKTVLIQCAIFCRHENIFCRSRHNYIRKFLIAIIRKLRAAAVLII